MEEASVLFGAHPNTYTPHTHTQLSKEEYDEKLSASTTLYVGNLSFYTSEEQIYELFSMCGDVKRVIMGLDRFKKTPCGFCFVEYPHPLLPPPPPLFSPPLPLPHNLLGFTLLFISNLASAGNKAHKDSFDAMGQK